MTDYRTPVPRLFSLLICDPQPVVSAGVSAILAGAGGIAGVQSAQSLNEARRLFASSHPLVFLVDKAFGAKAITSLLSDARANSELRCVVWGSGFTPAEVFVYFTSGAAGILQKSAHAGLLLECLQTVASGSKWLHDSPLSAAATPLPSANRELTPREHQVCDLVSMGKKNHEIADELGIQTGTVKIHLKHIFEKTGIRNRYGLALSGLRAKELREQAAAVEATASGHA